jgi:predicted transcriptional regulator
MLDRDRRKLHGLGRSATLLRIHEYLVRYVVVSVPRTAAALTLSEPTVYKGVRRLEDAGIVREVTGRQRGRVYVYDEYLRLLEDGTEETP